MLVHLTVLDDCVIVSVRPNGAGIVGESAHEMQVIGPDDRFHDVDYQSLRQLGEGEHELTAKHYS
jgi:hypothetical protein